MSRWTREELLLALGLYFETPFGKQHKTHPSIVELAGAIGRTPSSVAMKLNNFTSLDPSETERGIKGLTGASKLDRAIWAEFQADRERLVDEIEAQREANTPHAPADHDTPSTPTSPTQKQALTTLRRHQGFFRRVVLASYGSRCCIPSLPIPELLRASHIVPWSESSEHRLNPRNGLCLAATFDAAFDRGLITFDDKYRLVIVRRLREFESSDEIKSGFIDREGMTMTLPEKNLPDLELLRWHRENVLTQDY